MKKYVVLFLLFPALLISIEVGYTNPVPIKMKDVVIVRSEYHEIDSLLVALGEIPRDSLKVLIAIKETRGIANPYRAKNKYGMLGKYQFSPRTLAVLGYDSIAIKNFLQDEISQERAMDQLLLRNYNYIKEKGLLKSVGKQINGDKITLSGILAGCHLVGAVSVKHYLHTKGSMEEIQLKKVKLRKVDANGTSIRKYLSILE